MCSENLSDSELSKRLSVLNESAENSAVTSPVRDSGGSRPSSEVKVSDAEERSKSPLSPTHSDDSVSSKSVSDET